MCTLTLYGHIKTAQQRTIIQKYGCWQEDCYIWYSEDGPGGTGAYPSTASVPTSFDKIMKL